MLEKVLIANRGEIALRVLRACKELGIKTVAVHSTADKDLMHVRLSDESVCIGPPAAAESYLNVPSIIAAMELTDADAVHPGYGFLSENADFAEQVENSGFVFIGPTAETIRMMGDKVSAIDVMREAGVPTVPGSNGPLDSNNERTLSLAKKIGYPVIIKAAAGGGGRGMRVVHNEAALLKAIHVTQTEAKSFFGDGTVYLEKFLENPRHVEIQVIGDGQGNAICLGDRDCSLQRRHQKVIEEAPAPGIPDDVRTDITNTCIQACKNMKYRGAGTLEFLYEDERFYFIEMNTRVQVEHPVTEMVTGIDIVKEQLCVASGEPLSVSQEDISITGHSFECRINAEDPATFLPSPGKVKLFHAPGGPGVRVDSHLYSGYAVPPFYDSLVAKLISHASTREQALVRMQIALDELLIDGIRSNIPLHRDLVRDREFQRGGVNIHYLENKLES
ncbi:MAG: acetyl-CoA carboxylase biotin carboxylase subunit [Pseudomonadales bacterium]|jgi:acetyl-CoA carboxylase biotin carboxylase subunit|uniref:Biotin carboxylase n=1 Tax=OM182 bacterium TaxID=2510334 RepID=A0A520RXQ2_9GAMM|nr:acetyl-CoA carboxylase biotin carboxylase subunit [Pseudomonadales bacterium]RPG44679.1 MAG: acetyl-CoA carboxylase biotin carboxylase subunit [Gammaproteobacteria bacterium TMED163]RZO75010.1 MAG: acetyl-CoA carboxylase biotin carboxylase subunit [OM182 bacterium]HAR90319.1 acetyl-CoA carboxylase biotin carboxylase subunit [Gammaproteobacteria bacterium]HBQ00822.1 acetyl-CoA carboxylase biotin carboxylase subunit [Gammaproteobacteria bacterium]|tara:strand:- start:2044 stop:3384 length:1341 start_codon:yes stop_codon:yes gene_type:complete